jgi:oxidase EvaA
VICRRERPVLAQINENIIAFLDDEGVIETDMTMFCWASLGQIKELALMDNVVSPFVKTILLPP